MTVKGFQSWMAVPAHRHFKIISNLIQYSPVKSVFYFPYGITRTIHPNGQYKKTYLRSGGVPEWRSLSGVRMAFNSIDYVTFPQTKKHFSQTQALKVLFNLSKRKS